MSETSPLAFVASQDANELRHSVRTIVNFLLQSKDIHDKHRKRFLDRCLWQLAEAEGKHKYDLRYTSIGAQPLLESGVKIGLRHEHVWRRADMVERLLDHSNQVEQILSDACGCVVTVSEHKRLDQVDRAHPEVDGWERYRRARIRVYDRLVGKFKTLD